MALQASGHEWDCARAWQMLTAHVCVSGRCPILNSLHRLLAAIRDGFTALLTNSRSNEYKIGLALPYSPAR